MNRTIETLGKTNQTFLKTTFGFKSITQAKKALGASNNLEAYEVMKDLYNEKIEDERQEKIKQKKYDAREVKTTIKKMKADRAARRTYKAEALNGTFKEYYIYADEIPRLNKSTPIEDIIKMEGFVSKLLTTRISQDFKGANQYKNMKTSIRCFIVIKCLMYKENADAEGKTIVEYREHFYNGEIRNIFSLNNISTYVNDTLQGFYESVTNPKDGSDWRFKKFIKFTIATNRYKSVLGKSYIELPKAIANKKACVNIKNKDNMCFDYCLIANFIYNEIQSKDKNEAYHYKKYWHFIRRPEGVEYPITTDQIQEYEELNNLQINVFELENFTEEVDDVRTCIKEVYKPNTHRRRVVNLLLIREGEKSHYVLIKHLSRLFASTTQNRTKFICPHCLTKSFLTGDLLEKHVIHCANYDEIDKMGCDVEYEMPEEDKNILKFNNKQNQFKHPFHVTADFESTLFKIEDNNETSTQKYQKHFQNSFGLKYNCIHTEYDEDIFLFNSDNPELVCQKYIEKLEEYAMKSYEMIQSNRLNIIFKDDEKETHKNATHCDECRKKFTNVRKVKNKVLKVAHHDHITGNFISSLCSTCNLKFQYKTFLPVYLHNLKGYDAHLFINALHKYGQTGTEISCIPNNEERYISFSKNIKVGEYYCKKYKKIKPIMFEIRFLDTLGFMNSSIESLVNNLRSGCKTVEKLREAFPNTSKHFNNNTQFEFMTQKGVYPYDYIDTYDKLNLAVLPPKEAFKSRLYDAECSDEDYKQAEDVWKAFGCETFLDYHNLYLKSDVLLLADIWENFRNTCYKNYELDCCYYYTAPGLSFDAMLKFTKVKLELFTEQDMYEFCESGIRGGLSQISTRHAVANNKYMTAYNPQTEDSYILYLDANNLYGWAMSQYLPMKDFKWNTEEWSKEKIMNIADDAKTGYKFKCWLHIPEHLHDKFNNYVPCPENVQVLKEDLSEWQQEGYKQSKIRKLCCSFKDKKNYVVDYRYLKLVLSLGVELKEVSQVLEYTQSNFLKSYIELNTNLRKKAANDFEKDFFKLMNNSVFGKTMENVRQRINFRLVSTDDQAWRVKNLNRFTIFSENLVGVHIQKKTIKLNKPVYLGQTILDDSKYLMYDFHYNFMLEKIPRADIDLLFTDTDSLCYNVRKHDVFKLMKDNKDYFDLSEYPETHELYDASNKKVIGKFKNESVKPMKEFVGLRAKLYAYSVDEDDSKHLKCKGVKTCAAKKQLNIDMYRNVLYGRTKQSIKQSGIRSYGHQLFTEEVTKTALSARDDKIYICDDNINTRNFGHYKNNK